MGKALFLLLVLLSSTAHAAQDYRGYIDSNSPDTFEKKFELDSSSLGNLYIFQREHLLLWEVFGVEGFSVYNGEVNAILADGVVHLADNACGGIIPPEGAVGVSYIDDLLVISSDTAAHLYYIPECVKFMELPPSAQLAVSKSDSSDNRVLCGVDDEGRTVRDLLGGVLYSDDYKQSLAVAGYAERCYYLNSDGSLDIISLDIISLNIIHPKGGYTLQSVPLYGGQVSTAGGYHGDVTGFFGITQSDAILIKISDTLGVELNIFDVAEQFFINGTLYDTATFTPKMLLAMGSADKVSGGDDVVYLLDNGVLKGYSVPLMWEKSVQFTYQNPLGCTANGVVYITDIVGSYSVTEGSFAYTSPPSGCVPLRYESGGFYSSGGQLVHRYADVVKELDGRTLYRAANGGRLIYFVEG